jgi:hypothetical protein
MEDSNAKRIPVKEAVRKAATELLGWPELKTARDEPYKPEVEAAERKRSCERDGDKDGAAFWAEVEDYLIKLDNAARAEITEDLKRPRAAE